jgi:hypothetical protein
MPCYPEKQLRERCTPGGASFSGRLAFQGAPLVLRGVEGPSRDSEVGIPARGRMGVGALVVRVHLLVGGYAIWRGELRGVMVKNLRKTKPGVAAVPLEARG